MRGETLGILVEGLGRDRYGIQIGGISQTFVGMGERVGHFG